MEHNFRWCLDVVVVEVEVEVAMMMIAKATSQQQNCTHNIFVNNLRIFSDSLETVDGKFLMRKRHRHVHKMNFSSPDRDTNEQLNRQKSNIVMDVPNRTLVIIIYTYILLNLRENSLLSWATKSVHSVQALAHTNWTRLKNKKKNPKMGKMCREREKKYSVGRKRVKLLVLTSRMAMMMTTKTMVNQLDMIQLFTDSMLSSDSKSFRNVAHGPDGSTSRHFWYTSQ